MKFVAAVTSPPNLCAITEFVERGNLARILASGQELTWKQRLFWARDVAEGTTKNKAAE